MIVILAKSGLQLLLLLLVAPLLSGIIRTMKARLQTRRGPGILQPYRDLFKLLHKGMVIPDTASWIFSAAPYMVFVTATLVGLMIPMAGDRCPPQPFRWCSRGGLSFGARAFFPGPRRPRHRKLVRRPRQQPGNDDFGDRRAGHDARDFHGGPERQFHKPQ